MSSTTPVDPELLKRIQALSLLAREVADGVLMGIHHAPQRGRSLEFAEHKEYSPGDDIRRIDWKLFGKTDRLYLKEFEDDTNVDAVMLVDGTRSMDYSGDPGSRMTKLDYARLLAASLGYLLLTQSDAVGMGVMAEGLGSYLPPLARKTHFHEITRRLVEIEPHRGTDVSKSLGELASMIKGRAVVVIFSDLMDDPDTMLKAIRLFRHRRQEIILFHVLDPDEIEFPFERLSMFEDMEGPERLLVDPRSIREEYLKNAEEFIREVREECRGRSIDYWLTRTDEDPAKLLSSFLSFRAATTGARARKR